MDGIKQWIICVIFSSLISAVVTVISPKGSTKRAMQTVVSVFMLSAFLSPFLIKQNIDFEFAEVDFSKHESSLSSTINESMLSQAELQAKIKTEELLLSLAINDFSVDAEADVNEENVIYIKTIFITLSFDFSHREKQITSNLKTMFDTEVNFKWVKS